MAAEQDFPIQLVEEPDGSALRWTASVIVLTTIALALFNAAALAAWTEDLVPGPASAHAVSAAESWQGTTTRIGLDSPYAGVHRTWKGMENARWPGGKRT